MDKVKGYLDAVNTLLGTVSHDDIRKVGDLLIDAYKNDKLVFVMGNGGSAATASHFVCDLQKGVRLESGRRFRVMSVTDHIPLITAWANDFGYSDIFAGQIAPWIEAGDLVIGISGSGNSPNVIKGIELAEAKGAVTVGISGFQGGKLAQAANHNIIVHSEDMQHIEDVHMVISHLLFRYLLEEIAP